MKRHRLVVIHATIFALATVVLSSGVASAANGHAGRSGTDHMFAHSSPSSGHLYVLEHAYKAVYRFPLAQDGLPATQPDSVMYLQGAVYPEGLAVDKVGHVFVADPEPNSWGCPGAPALCQPTGSVAEFAAGATGQQLPISVLHLNTGPDRLNIDDAGRLYVHYSLNQDIAVFAKGAHGNDAPISVVPPYKQGLLSDYVIAKSGSLFALWNVQPVAVYDDPLHNPSKPNRLIMPDGGNAFDATLAMNEERNRLYIQFYVSNQQYWDKVNYDVRLLSGAFAASAVGPWIFTGDCGPINSYIVGGTVIIKKYLIVSCNYSQGVVFVYRADQFGRQRAPVEVVGQGIFNSPWEMAVGP